MKRIALTLSLLMLTGALSLFAQKPADIPTGKRFHIQSAMNYVKNNGGYWDIPGRPSTIERRSNVQVWSLDDRHDREFTFIKSPVIGYYEIQVGNTRNSRVDIQGQGRKNGSNVHTWTSTGNPNQHFLFHHLGNGRFKIYDRNSGKILCLKGRSNKNGTNVHIWSDHNGASVEWYLIDAKTKRAYIPRDKPTGRPSGKPSGSRKRTGSSRR